MTSASAPLTWCEAARGCGCGHNHAQDLQLFVCADPPPRGVMPKHRNLVGSTWERDVQSGIRNIRPPVPAGDLLLLGYDDVGLAAVSHSFEIDGPAYVKILAAARARRCRGMGYGDVVLDETLNRVAERAGNAGCQAVLVQGLVHHRNQPSQAMVDRNGFFYYADDDGGLQEWYLRIDLV